MHSKLSIHFLSLLSSMALCAIPPFDQREVSIAVDAAGNQVAVWEENEVIMASEQPAQGDWSIPVILSNPTMPASLPQLEIDPSSGDATAIWLENESLKAASKPLKGKWDHAELEPTLIEEDSEEPAPRKRVAIVLVPPEEDEAKSRSYSGAFTSPKAGSRRSSPSRKKGGKGSDGPALYGPSRLKDEEEWLRLAMANAIDAPTGGVLSGAEIGYTTSTAAPTNGMVVSGQVGVGTSSVTANTRMQISLASTDVTGLLVAGTTTASGGTSTGVSISSILAPSGAANFTYGLLCQPTQRAAGGSSISGVAACRLSNLLSSNAGTITNAYGVWFDGGSFGGTVTNNYGGYFTAPVGGTNKCSLYADDLSIGYTGTTPTSNGAIISGRLGVGTSSITANTRAQVNMSATDTVGLSVKGATSATSTTAGIFIGPVYSPAMTVTNMRGLDCQPDFQPLAGVTNAVAAYFIPVTTSSSGTITNLYGVWVDSGSSTSGTVTNGYGGYFANPVAGTKKCALYGDNLSIGYTATTPPTNGAIISGNVYIGASSTQSTNAKLQTTLTGYNYSGTDGTSTVGIYTNGTTAGIGTFSNHYLSFFTNNSGALVQVGPSGGLVVGTGYVFTTPPTQGAIIQGQVGIGSSAPASGHFFSTYPNGSSWASSVSVFGTYSGKDSNREWGLLVNPTLNPTGGASDRVVGIESTPVIVAPSSTTITNAMGFFTNVNWGSNVGRISQATNCYVGSGTGGAGTIPLGVGIWVEQPTMATTNYTAILGGGTSRLLMDSTGLLFPETSNVLDLGKAGNRFLTIYSKNALNVGTSRLCKSQMKCPSCGETMMRGTGTLVILGETGDYIPCWCENAGCLDKGHMHMDKIQHLPPAKLAQRRPVPKIELLGFDVRVMSGNSRTIQIRFRYIDKDPEDTTPGGHTDNATCLSDVEFAAFMAMTSSQQLAFLQELGQREWDSLEELRLMKEECAALQQELDAKFGKWINTDLLKR